MVWRKEAFDYSRKKRKGVGKIEKEKDKHLW